MDDFNPSNITHFHRPLENGVEQLKRSAVDPADLSRSAARPSSSSSSNDSLDRHMIELRQLIATQVELVEKNKLQGRNVERSKQLLIMLNDLMANYQILRQRNERRT